MLSLFAGEHFVDPLDPLLPSAGPTVAVAEGDGAPELPELQSRLAPAAPTDTRPRTIVRQVSIIRAQRRF